MLRTDYDLRGIFKKDLTFEIIDYCVKQFFKKIDNKKPLLAVDFNKNNLIIKEFLLKNFSFEYLGVLPTPIFYYQANKIKKPGIMITASHLPKSYSGLKFLLANGKSWKPKIKIQKSDFNQVRNNKEQKIKLKEDNFQKEINFKIYQEYFEKLRKIVKPKKEIIVNFDKKNFFLNFSLPYFEKLNIFDDSKSLIKVKSDLDNDRIFIYYQNKLILPDAIFYTLALNKKYKNLGVPVYFSQKLKEELLKLNKKIFIIPTGHYHFKEAFFKYNLDLAFEPSGHFYMFKELKTEAPYLALALFLHSFPNFEDLIKKNKFLKRFNLKIKDNYSLENLIISYKQKFGLKLYRFDGYLLRNKDFILHLRKSKTENKLRFSLEVLRDEVNLNNLLKEIKNAARSFN
jgi:phosphomannomutase